MDKKIEILSGGWLSQDQIYKVDITDKEIRITTPVIVGGILVDRDQLCDECVKRVTSCE